METILRVKERPILFSGQMVAAILAGTKTQTRRVITERYQACLSPEDEPEAFLEFCPYGQVGDRLYVKEAWRTEAIIDHMNATEMAEACLDAGYSKPWAPIEYSDGKRINCESWDKNIAIGRWRPSIFMPRWASRITLEVTEVRLERVQDISTEDAFAEGLASRCRGVDYPRHELRDAFEELWNEINGKRGYTWESNPWVFAISFRRIE